jgi:mono/diheme cytochrome c family protein
MRASRIPFRIASLCLMPFAILLTSHVSPVWGQEKDTKSSKDAKTYHAIETVPEKARARSNPLENQPDAQVAGGKLYEQHCAECHGNKAEGGKKGASLLKPQVAQATPGALFWILTNGVIWRDMPDWSKLPEQQRWQIVAFLKSLKPSASLQNLQRQPSLAIHSSGATNGKLAMDR